MPEPKWKPFIARPVEIEAYQVKERTIVQQKADERTTGRVYAQVGAWVVAAQPGELYDTIISDEEFKRLYQPAKKGDGVPKTPPKEKEEEGSAAPSTPVDPSAMEVKA